MKDIQKAWKFDGPFTQDRYEAIQQQHGLTGAELKGQYPSRYGIRSAFPRSTPKYARYIKQLNHEFTATTARMYIQVASDIAYNALLQEQDNQAVKAIASVLVGGKTEGSKTAYGVPFGGNGYIDFLLQQANHSLNEKYQVVETLSDNYVAFFFGQSAPIFQYSGSLMNTFQDDWAINMLRLYQSLGRGSQLARRGVLFYLRYDSIAVSGSLLNLNWSLTGDVEIVVPFSFNMLVRKIHFLYGGLEPPTDIGDDGTVLKPSMSFWPMRYNPNESYKELQGHMDDNMGGASPMGSGTQTKVNQTPPAASPEETGNGLPGSEGPPNDVAVPVEIVNRDNAGFGGAVLD
jgi:hypothetical protein